MYVKFLSGIFPIDQTLSPVFRAQLETSVELLSHFALLAWKANALLVLVEPVIQTSLNANCAYNARSRTNESEPNKYLLFLFTCLFSGRTEKQAQRDAQLRMRSPPQFTRTPSRRYQRRIVEGAQDGKLRSLERSSCPLINIKWKHSF